jgi:DNA-binding transcriptional MerR regulator
MPKFYSSKEVARLCRVSLRQLQYWDEGGLTKPEFHEGAGGFGHKRAYSREEVIRVDLIAQLRRKSIPFQQVKRLKKYLLQSPPGRELLVVSAKVKATAMWCNPAEAIAAAANASSGVFVVQRKRVEVAEEED